MAASIPIPDPPPDGHRGLRLHEPPPVPTVARWLINGFPATILTWTAEEWRRSTDKPGDAQEFPNGVRCALRME